METPDKLTKQQIRIRTKNAFFKMRHYLVERGYDVIKKKKGVITRLYADLKYSENVYWVDDWILRKVLAGEFDGMKMRYSKPEKQIKKQKISEQKSSYSEFLRSPYWREVRKLVLARDGNKCTKCGSITNLHIHHNHYKNHMNEMEHLDDLITLCEVCHMEIHNKKKNTKKKTKKRATKK